MILLCTSASNHASNPYIEPKTFSQVFLHAVIFSAVPKILKMALPFISGTVILAKETKQILAVILLNLIVLESACHTFPPSDLLNTNSTSAEPNKNSIMNTQKQDAQDTRYLSPPFRQWNGCPDGEAYIAEKVTCLKEGL